MPFLVSFALGPTKGAHYQTECDRSLYVRSIMVPVGWKWALLVWGYALAWFFVNDWIKLAAYRVIDPQGSLLVRRRR
jgi:hypothetical protein